MISEYASLVALDMKICSSVPLRAAIRAKEKTQFYLRNVRVDSCSAVVETEAGPTLAGVTHVPEYISLAERKILSEKPVTPGLPVQEVTEYRPRDLALWINAREHGAVPNDGKDDTAAIQSAINACPENGVVYLPYGEYDLQGDLTVDGSGVRRIDFCGSTVNAAGSRLILKRVDNPADELMVCNVNTHMDYEQAGSSRLVVMDDSLPTTIQSTEESTGDIVAENCGSLFRCDIRNNNVWLHSCNPERTQSFFSGSQVWAFGWNWELKTPSSFKVYNGKGQMVFSSGCTTELYVINDSVNHDFSWEDKDHYGGPDYKAGMQIPISEELRAAPVYRINDSRVAIVGAGAHRWFDGRQRAYFRARKNGEVIYHKGFSCIGNVLEQSQGGTIAHRLFHGNDASDLPQVITGSTAMRTFMVWPAP
jgi:hypothetical protein